MYFSAVRLNELIPQLQNFFKNGRLPGENAQFRLAPSKRRNEVLTFDKEYRQSAVLLLLYPDTNANARLVYILRNVYDGVHSGQIGFPGGAKEAGDKTLWHTAVRETEEEIGVKTTSIHKIGALSSLKIPVSSYQIFPYVAYTSGRPQFMLDTSEVQEIYEVTIDELLNTSVKQGFFTSSDRTRKAPYYPIAGKRLWGATAMITAEFLAILDDVST